MKILLTSQGLTTEAIKNKFFEIVGKTPDNISIAFIPTAAYPTADKPWVHQTREEILKTGIKKLEDVDLKDYKEQELYKKLGQFDVIWVNGGNTFYLLHWVRKSGFDKVIKKLLEEGKVYVGLSAGSYIACPTIEMAGWKHVDEPKVVEIDDLTGLELVNFYVFVHYADEWKATVEENKDSLDGKLICLTDSQAVTKGQGII